MAEMTEAEDILYRNGFVRCDIAACGCGSWHARYGLRERFDELNRAMEDAGEQLNGVTLLGAVQALIAERDALRKDAERWKWVRSNAITLDNFSYYIDDEVEKFVDAEIADAQALG